MEKPVPKHNQRYFQIDILKSVMMALVIMDHSFTHQFLHAYGNPFWERISIPVLMVIMGFNAYQSYEKQESLKGSALSLREMYSWAYFKKKIRRFLFPYMLLYVIDFVLEKALSRFSRPDITTFPYESTVYELYGFTPLWGPGMWFIPVMLGSIFILPLIYFCFKRSPIGTVVMTFVVEIAMQYARYRIYEGQWWFTSWFFVTSILFMLSAIGLGMWLGRDHRLISRRSVLLWILFIPSLAYIYMYATDSFDQFLPGGLLDWISGDYHFLTFPYSAVIVLITINLIPTRPNVSKFPRLGKIEKWVKTISNATFHILLTQMLWFSIWYHYRLSIFTVFDNEPMNYLWFFPLNLFVGFTGGIIWYRCDEWFFTKIKEIPICALLYYTGMLLSIIFLISWLFGQFYAFLKYPIPENFVVI